MIDPAGTTDELSQQLNSFTIFQEQPMPSSDSDNLNLFVQLKIALTIILMTKEKVLTSYLLMFAMIVVNV